jgi:hypothetical protein
VKNLSPRISLGTMHGMKLKDWSAELSGPVATLAMV